MKPESELCEFCKEPVNKMLATFDLGDKELFVDVCGRFIRIFDSDYPGIVESVYIRFCPMCGRRLP